MVRCSKLGSTFTKKIPVDTNDPSMPRPELICEGRILEPMRVDPPGHLNFGRVSRGSPEVRAAVLVRADGPPIHPSVVPAPDSGFTTSIKELEPGERYELELKLTPNTTGTRTTSTLKIATGIPEAPEISYPVYASFAPDVESSPESFKVPVQRDGDWEQAVELIWNIGGPHHILSATANAAGLAVEVREDAGRQKVVLKVPQAFSGKGRAGRVLIQTDDPQHATLEVPILVMASPAPRAAPRPRTGAAQPEEGSDRAAPTPPSQR